MKNTFITGSTGFIGKRLIKLISGRIRVSSRRKLLDYVKIVCNLEKHVIPNNALEGIDTVPLGRFCTRYA